MLYYYCAGLTPPSVVDVGPAFFMLLFIQESGRIIPSDFWQGCHHLKCLFENLASPTFGDYAISDSSAP